MKYTKVKKYYCIKANYHPNPINSQKVKILGSMFINNNKDKCKIIYKNKIYELREYFEEINTNYNHKDSFKLKIIFFNNIINMNSIFSECDTLFSFSDNIEPELDKNLITEFNQLNIENIQTYDLISNTDTNDFYTESSSLSINQSFKKKSYERNYKINDIKNKGLLSYL